MEDMSNLLSELSKIVEKNGIPDDLKDIINNINSDSNKENNTNNDIPSYDFSNIDIQTFLKIKSALDKMNSKDNPNAKLLTALKPYLKDTKKEKIDQYIKLMNISNILEIFNNEGGKNGL